MTDMPAIELHNASYRVNPSGSMELVKKKKGKKDEETLNELAQAIIDLLESIEYSGPLEIGGGAGSPEQIVNQRRRNVLFAPEYQGASGDLERVHGDSPNNFTSSTRQSSDGPEQSRAKSDIRSTPKSDALDKYISDRQVGVVDYHATKSESFTGTGAIAIAPGIVPQRRKKRKSQKISENIMSDLINEWEPKFAAGNYDPGDYQMPSPTGKGVASTKPKKWNVGSYDTELSDTGEPFGGKHNDTPAMCDVDENGVENKPQGSHQSSVGKPTDGHQTEVNHNWPDGPKNDGNGVAEPFDGDRWSDGGVLHGEASSEGGNSGHKQALPKDGPIKGTSGPQMGQPSESWSPENISSLMEYNDVDIQRLFDAYASKAEYICLEDFQDLLLAYGDESLLSEQSLLQLMDANQQFVFHEGNDANGRYWVGFFLNEEGKPWEDNDDDDDNGTCEECGRKDCNCPHNESRSRRGRTLNEYQERSPELEVDRFRGPYPQHDSDFDYEPFGPGDEISNPQHGDPHTDLDYDEREPLDYHDEMDEYDEGVYNDHDDEESMFGGRDHDFGDELDDVHGEMPHDLEELDHDLGHLRGEHRTPEAMESLQNFLDSARQIIEQSKGQFSDLAIGEALQYSWEQHAGGVDPRHAPSKVRQSLGRLANAYPTFDPLTENDAMGPAAGTAISSGSASNSSSFLPKTPGPKDMEDRGDPFGGKQKNTAEKTPIINGTAKGMSGTGQSQSVKENVTKLAKYVERKLSEISEGIRGKYGMKFCVLVQEGRNLNRTPRRQNLAQALVDAEEILQVHRPNDVVFEAFFHDGEQVIRKVDINLPSVKKRGPLVSEGKALFRFRRTAEKFADELVSEGVTCRLMSHNWGQAVAAKVNYKTATKAFQAIIE